MEVEEGRLPVGTSTDLNLDTTVVTQSDGVKAHREGVFIGDGEEVGNRANVVEEIRQTRFALLVADENSRAIYGALEMIVQQNEDIKMLLSSIAE